MKNKVKKWLSALVVCGMLCGLAACKAVPAGTVPEPPKSDVSTPVESDPVQDGKGGAQTDPEPSGATDDPAGAGDAQKDADAADWKAEFEKSLWENYGVRPTRYEDLGDGIYQVYVQKDSREIPFVAVDSATGEYHG